MIRISSVNFLTAALMLVTFFAGLPVWSQGTQTPLSSPLPILQQSCDLQQSTAAADYLVKKSALETFLTDLKSKKPPENKLKCAKKEMPISLCKDQEYITIDQIQSEIDTLQGLAVGTCPPIGESIARSKNLRTTEKREEKKTCEDLDKQLKDAERDMNKACNNAKVKKGLSKLKEEHSYEDEPECKNSTLSPDLQSLCNCKAKANICANLNEEDGGVEYASGSEAAIGVLQNLNGIEPYQMDGKQYQQLCIPITKEKIRELKQDKKSLQDEAKDLERELKELQSNKELERIEEEIAAAKRKAREEDFDEYTNKTKADIEKRQSRVDAESKITEMRNAITKKINDQRIAVLRFGQQINTLKDAVIQRNCMDRLEEAINKRKSKSSLERTGGPASVIVQQGAIQKQKDSDIKACMVAARAERTIIRQEYQDKMKQMDEDIQQTQQMVKTAEDQLFEFDQKASEGELVKNINDKQAKAERLEAFNALLERRKNWIATRDQNLVEVQQKLQRLRTKINQASNELATADSRPLQEEGSSSSGGEVLAEATQKSGEVLRLSKKISTDCKEQAAHSRSKLYMQQSKESAN